MNAKNLIEQELSEFSINPFKSKSKKIKKDMTPDMVNAKDYIKSLKSNELLDMYSTLFGGQLLGDLDKSWNKSIGALRYEILRRMG